MTPLRPHSRRPCAFTVLELVLALALTTLVLGSAFGILGMLRSADRVTNESARDAVELAYTQAVLRNAMNGALAATPLPAPQAANTAPDDDTDAGDGDIDPETQALAEQAQTLAGEQAGIDPQLERIVATADTSEPPYFELWYEDHQGVTLPRLAVVVATPPPRFGRGRTTRDHTDPDAIRRDLLTRWAGRIRGVIDLRWGGQRGWILTWTPESPPAEPTALIDNVTLLQWEVLIPPKDEDGNPLPPGERVDAPPDWREVHAAYLQRDFPDAVRLILETRNGSRVDWLFELSPVTIAENE